VKKSASYTLQIDESHRGRYLGLGGLICRSEDVTAITEAWTRLKTDTMKVPARAELKWNLSPEERRSMGVVGTDWDKQGKVPTPW